MHVFYNGSQVTSSPYEPRNSILLYHSAGGVANICPDGVTEGTNRTTGLCVKHCTEVRIIPCVGTYLTFIWFAFLINKLDCFNNFL